MKLVFRSHALHRMFERHISVEDVRRIVDAGRAIHEYPNDAPYPSRLLLGWIAERPLHIVCADAGEQTIIITVYEPDHLLWEPGFERKKA